MFWLWCRGSSDPLCMESVGERWPAAAEVGGQGLQGRLRLMAWPAWRLSSPVEIRLVVSPPLATGMKLKAVINNRESLMGRVSLSMRKNRLHKTQYNQNGDHDKGVVLMSDNDLSLKMSQELSAVHRHPK